MNLIACFIPQLGAEVIQSVPSLKHAYNVNVKTPAPIRDVAPTPNALCEFTRPFVHVHRATREIPMFPADNMSVFEILIAIQHLHAAMRSVLILVLVQTMLNVTPGIIVATAHASQAMKEIPMVLHADQVRKRKRYFLYCMLQEIPCFQSQSQWLKKGVLAMRIAQVSKPVSTGNVTIHARSIGHV